MLKRYDMIIVIAQLSLMVYWFKFTTNTIKTKVYDIKFIKDVFIDWNGDDDIDGNDNTIASSRR